VKTIPMSEYARKGIHLSSSFIPLFYLWASPTKEFILGFIGSLILFSLLLEYGRKNITWGISIFNTYFNFMLRKHESKGALTGASWVLIGMFITIFIFQKYIAVLSILFMVFGDTFAALIGKSIPMGQIGQKTLSGSFGGLVVILAISFLLRDYVPFIPAVGGGIVAMIVEVLPIQLDDNLTIPLSSGLMMTFLTGGFA
jgi:glycerol-3-phosphate acyltransferase PlsY